jgi:hypothetical protein
VNVQHRPCEHYNPRTMFLKFSAISDHFTGGRRTRGHRRKITQTQKYIQVNRRNITPVARVGITTFFIGL